MYAVSQESIVILRGCAKRVKDCIGCLVDQAAYLTDSLMSQEALADMCSIYHSLIVT